MDENPAQRLESNCGASDVFRVSCLCSKVVGMEVESEYGSVLVSK